jgi:hypothetical protein
MRKKLGWLVFLGASVIAIAGSALATPPEGFTSTTTAQGQIGSFDVINYFVSSKDKLWLSSQETKGKSDEYFLTNVWEPGGTTGWHTHPGHTLIIVTAGTVTHYDAHDPKCTPHVYTAGMSFVATYTSFETKVMSRHKSLLSGSFQQVSRAGLTPQILVTAPSDKDGRNRHQASFAKTVSILPAQETLLHS